jgi:hypothetical protein
MLKRYQNWTEANPLWDWLLSVTISLAFFLTLFYVIPGPKKPGFALLLVSILLSSPTTSLLRRFSDERQQAQPISPQQELGIGLLALLSSVCSLGALGMCLLEKRLNLSMDAVGAALMVFSVSALLSLGLGHAARHSWAGRWGFRLTIGWLVVILGMAVVMMLCRGFTHM